MPKFQEYRIETNLVPSPASYTVILPDIIAEGDKVCLRYTNTGTHTGEYQGLAPTGKKFKTVSVEIYRITNGKIVEGWTVLDWFTELDFNQQIGIVKYKGYPKEGLF